MEADVREKFTLWHLQFFIGESDGKKIKIYGVSERSKDYEKCSGSTEAGNRTRIDPPATDAAEGKGKDHGKTGGGKP
jgi:hypothetical protein